MEKRPIWNLFSKQEEKREEEKSQSGFGRDPWSE